MPPRKDKRKPPLGTGERFRQLAAELSERAGVRDPKALAAWIGRRKYGAKTMAALAAAGRRRRSNPWSVRYEGTDSPADDLRDAIRQAKALVEDFGGTAYVLHDGQVYQIVTSRKRTRKRNPDPIEDAAELYQEFHGRPARSVRELEDELHVRDVFTDLGTLVELDVETPDGEHIRISAPGARLVASPDGTQLYIEGGDQSLDPRQLGLPDKDLITVGVLHSVTYRTQKSFDGFELVDYQHEFGEEGGERPLLLYDALNRRLLIAGGSYHIKPEGIVN
jgi:hypothetical protein